MSYTKSWTYPWSQSGQYTLSAQANFSSIFLQCVSFNSMVKEICEQKVKRSLMLYYTFILWAESDDEDDDVAQSSLDVNAIARQALKRRASDSYQTHLGVNKSHIKGRKGSLSPFEEVSKRVSVLMHRCGFCSTYIVHVLMHSRNIGHMYSVLKLTLTVAR